MFLYELDSEYQLVDKANRQDAKNGQANGIDQQSAIPVENGKTLHAEQNAGKTAVNDMKVRKKRQEEDN